MKITHTPSDASKAVSPAAEPQRIIIPIEGESVREFLILVAEEIDKLKKPSRGRSGVSPASITLEHIRSDILKISGSKNGHHFTEPAGFETETKARVAVGYLLGALGDREGPLNANYKLAVDAVLQTHGPSKERMRKAVKAALYEAINEAGITPISAADALGLAETGYSGKEKPHSKAGAVVGKRNGGAVNSGDGRNQR